MLRSIVLVVVESDPRFDRSVPPRLSYHHVLVLAQSVQAVSYSHRVYGWPSRVEGQHEFGMCIVDFAYSIPLIRPLNGQNTSLLPSLDWLFHSPNTHGGLSFDTLLDLNCCCWLARASLRKSTFGGGIIVSRKGIIGAETVISIRAYLDKHRDFSGLLWHKSEKSSLHFRQVIDAPL